MRNHMILFSIFFVAVTITEPRASPGEQRRAWVHELQSGPALGQRPAPPGLARVEAEPARGPPRQVETHRDLGSLSGPCEIHGSGAGRREKVQQRDRIHARGKGMHIVFRFVFSYSSAGRRHLFPLRQASFRFPSRSIL